MSIDETFYVCPVHGVLSEREAGDIYQGHDGTFFGSTPDGDGYTEDYYCGQYSYRDDEECRKKLREVRLKEVEA